MTWYVLAGWALDLFHGRQTRDHDDLEIGVAYHEFGAIRDALDEFELFVVGDGLAWPVTESNLARHRQTWVREPDTGLWRVDLIPERWEGNVWTYRRDARIRLRREQLIAKTSDGIPYAEPEVVLLFKAGSPRPKDDQDFARALPFLDRRRRSWLSDALQLVHPRHPWLAGLADA